MKKWSVVLGSAAVVMAGLGVPAEAAVSSSDVRPAEVSVAEVTAPSEPTAVAARAGSNQASVAWQPPASDGGSPVTLYTATASPGGNTCTADGPATSCVVTGLTNGVSYTFTVTATNAVGTSASSAPSNAVTPAPDTSGPVVLTSAVAPTRVSGLGGEVDVEVRITDDVSGLRGDPVVEFRRYANYTSHIFGRTTLKRTSGDEFDGTYRGTVTVPSGLAGYWTLYVETLTDNSENYAFTRPTTAKLAIGTAAAPTNVVATADADRQVTVSWDPPSDDGGNVITGYEVTTSPPSGISYTTTTSLKRSFATWPAIAPISFTVKTINAAGTGEPSAASADLTIPATVPSAPPLTSAVPGVHSITGAWNAPGNGGSPITKYTLTAQPGGESCTTTGLNCTISGLDPATAYTVTVTATNAVGTSVPSTPSQSLTPKPIAPKVSSVNASNVVVYASGVSTHYVYVTVYDPDNIVYADASRKFSVTANAASGTSAGNDGSVIYNGNGVRTTNGATYDTYRLVSDVYGADSARGWRNATATLGSASTPTSSYTKSSVFKVQSNTYVSSFNATEPVKKGSTTKITGKLMKLEYPWQGLYEYRGYGSKALTVQFKKAGTSTWVNKGTVTTNSYGNFTKYMTADYDGTWRVYFPGNTWARPRYSAGDYVDVQ